MKILVAEDEQRAREGLCELISSLGEKYQIIGSAANGRDALAMIQDMQPDVVFTDIKMPYMSGLELIRAARKQRLETRFVLTSAYAEFEYAKEAMKLGCDDYILKPPMRSELQKTLDNVEHILKYGSRQEQKNDSLEQQYPQAHKLVRRTLQMIESGYKGNLNQQYIAQQLEVSPEYLSYLFARDIGITFARFIREYRIHQAARLLRKGTFTVKDVAYETGFTDRKYFCKVFHEVMGESVSEYMKHL